MALLVDFESDWTLEDVPKWVEWANTKVDQIVLELNVKDCWFWIVQIPKVGGSTISDFYVEVVPMPFVKRIWIGADFAYLG